MQWLRSERLRWEKGKPETVRYVCEDCEQPIAEHNKTRILARGEWRATAESSDPLTIGFHISSLYSPVGWLS
jgi:phage terminase large subunit GpA-like protein